MSPNLTDPQWIVYVSPPGSTYEERVDTSNRIISLSYEDVEDKADKLTLTVDNYDLTQLGNPVWQPGNNIHFQFGYPGAMSQRRTAKIAKVKGFSQLTVEALGAELSLSLRPRPDAYWENVTRSEVVREILVFHGAQESQLHIQETTKVFDQISQGPLNDLQLIRKLAALEGFWFYADFDGYHFHPRNLKQAPIRTLRYFSDPGRGDIEAGITMEDNRAPGKPGAVKIAHRDPSTKTTTVMTVTSGSENALASESTVYGTDANPALGLGKEHVMASSGKTLEEAIKEAESIVAAQQQKGIILTVPIRGDAGFLAKSVMRIENIGPWLSGEFYVTSAKHDLSSGYRTTLKVRSEGYHAPIGTGAFPSTTKKTEATVKPDDPATSTSTTNAQEPPAFKTILVRDTERGVWVEKQVPTGGRG